MARTTWVSRYQKGKTNLDFTEARDSGSGISWAICKSAPHSRQITTLAPHHSVFYRPDALPAAQPTASKHWKHVIYSVVVFVAVLLGFLNYYDAVAFGLKKASRLIKLGGPGGACQDNVSLTSYCWALLDHVQSGVNYFTGRKDVPLDFMSVHKKVCVLSVCCL